MGIKDVFKNVVTFGAHQRVENAMENYEELKREYLIKKADHEKRREEIQEVLRQVIKAKKIVFVKVRKTEEIVKNVSIKQREFINEKLRSENFSIDEIQASITAGDTAISATKGAVAGVGSALGTWALVGTFGVASTGTAIGTLSGAAASNAILAWLGGGSLAAGGGGIAAGTAVLGGLVAIPAIVITGVFQHLAANKKIQEIEKAKMEILDVLDKIKNNLVWFNAIELRSREMIAALGRSLKAYKFIYRRVYKHIFPLGNISKILKRLKEKIFRRPYFTEKDLGFIQELLKTTELILKMVDSPVL